MVMFVVLCLMWQDQGFVMDVVSFDKVVGMCFDCMNVLYMVDVIVVLNEKQMLEIYCKFEVMVLQNFFKYMMLNDSEDVYGKGMVGDIWKSMLVEQIVNLIVKCGGIGIVDYMMCGGIYDEVFKLKDYVVESGCINNIVLIIVVQQQWVGFVDLLLGIDVKIKG